MAGRRLLLRCPDCDAELTVDADTGDIVAHRRAKAPVAGGRDFDSLMKGLDEGKARAEARFEQEKAAMKDRQRLLDEKFAEAMRRAEEEGDEGPPPRPFDLD
ncbi:MAG TPA: 2-nitropropane dioxygenase [Thermoanaerobaculia bacterium]|nr:2-nitropropane dioxygenase [Thermoanaerobaculia bacterium]